MSYTNKEWTDGGWREVEQGKPLPENVKTVVLLCDVCNDKLEPTGKINTLVVRQPKNGWSPVIGWEFWYPLPSGVQI